VFLAGWILCPLTMALLGHPAITHTSFLGEVGYFKTGMQSTILHVVVLHHYVYECILGLITFSSQINILLPALTTNLKLGPHTVKE